MVFAFARPALRPLGLVAGLALVSCGGSGIKTPELPKPYVPTQNLVVRMHDTPIEAADHVFVTIERVDVYRRVEVGGEDDGGGTKVVKETVSSVPGQYDLLELQNGVEAVLGGGMFPAGDYKSIRLIVSKDSKDDIKNLPADQLKNYIVIDGVAHPLRVPSGAQTGIKLGKNFSISEVGTTVLTIDFDVRTSIRKCGKKDVYRLKPRLKIVPNVEEGTEASISGLVTTFDGSGLPMGTVVSVQQDGLEVASASVDPTTNEYSCCSLADGAYDVVVIAPGYTFDSEPAVTVTGGAGGTHSFEVAPSDAGAVYGAVSAPSLADVTVRLRWSGYVVATMDADPDDGTYLFDNVVVGDYGVEALDGASAAAAAAAVIAASATQVDLSL